MVTYVVFRGEHIVFLYVKKIVFWQSYIMWQIFMILCSFVPIILYLTGIIYVPYLALAALGTSVFLFLGTLIIGDRRARVELKRRFHIR